MVLMEGFKKYPDVFSVPVKGANGEEMFLKQFEGKILVFVNTTGHCGNARQWPILDMLQKEYADKNVQMVYLPTNDYCGSVTFGDYKNGIKDGKESAEYAKATYDIDAPFTELLSSRNEPWVYKVGTLNRSTGHISLSPEQEQQAALLTQEPMSPLFRFLLPDSESGKDGLGGNFHKFITNQVGLPVAYFDNSTFNNGSSLKNSVIGSIEEEIQTFRDCLDEIIDTGVCTHPTWGFAPYSLT